MADMRAPETDLKQTVKEGERVGEREREGVREREREREGVRVRERREEKESAKEEGEETWGTTIAGVSLEYLPSYCYSTTLLPLYTHCTVDSSVMFDWAHI